ncbi:hypothetical protein Tco_0754648 [Tanacetum coccineum]
MKVEILEFSGKVHPEDFIDRLSIVERVFDLKDIHEHLKVKLVAIRLRKHASLWQEDFLDYHNLSQRPLTVELINEFDKMRICCDANKKDEQVVARFLGCLRPEISDVMSLQQYMTYSDVCRLALKVKKQQNKSKGKMSVGRFIPVSKSTPTIVYKGDELVNNVELVYADRREALVIQRV